MADINEIKEIVFSTIGSVADKTREAAVRTADKAKCLARMARLSVEINAERDRIKKAYLEIGKLYYETHRDDPDGFFVQLCDEIGTANETIKAKELEIAELKVGVPDFSEDDFDLEDFDAEDTCHCGCAEHGGADEDFDEDFDEDEDDEDGIVIDITIEKAPKEEEKCDCGCEEHSPKPEDQ